jgi:hypothetical protein
MNVQDTLDERQHTHGDFAENARVMQAMKEVARSGVSWKHLTSCPARSPRNDYPQDRQDRHRQSRRARPLARY